MKAGIKPVTENPGISFATSKRMSALITKEKRPNVRKVKGRVKSVMIGRTKRLRILSTKAARSAIQKLGT